MIFAVMELLELSEGDTNTLIIKKCDKHFRDENICHEDKKKFVTVYGKEEKQFFEQR